MRRFARWAVFLGVATWLAACGDLVMPPGENDDGGVDESADEDAGDAALDGPRGARDAIPREDASTIHLVSFTASPTSVAPGGTVTFQVLVSDDLGVGNISTASLVDESGNTVTTFPASGGYMRTVTVTWSQISKASPPAVPAMRTFTAVLADRLGYTARASVQVSLGGAPAADGGAPAVDAGVDAARDAAHD